MDSSILQNITAKGNLFLENILVDHFNFNEITY